MKSVEGGGEREGGEERCVVISCKCEEMFQWQELKYAGSLAVLGSDPIAWHSEGLKQLWCLGGSAEFGKASVRDSAAAGSFLETIHFGLAVLCEVVWKDPL